MSRSVGTVFNRRRADIGAGIHFEPRDLWIGVHWKFRKYRGTSTGWDRKHGAYTGRPWTLDLYVCVFPMFPAHIWISRITRDAP